jgi:hypothetical protein
MNRVAWFWFRFDLPPGWEVTRYATSESLGRLELSSREGLRGQVSWERCRGTPDTGRMLVDFHRRRAEARGARGTFEPARVASGAAGPFRLAWCADGEPCVAGLFLERPRIYLQWVFESHSGRALETLWRPLLASFHPNDGPVREWCLLGLDAFLPADFELEEVQARPADVAFLFERGAREMVLVQRWGLPGELLRGTSLAEFYRARLAARRCRVRDARPAALAGREAAEVAFERRGEYQMDRLAGRRWPGRGTIWHESAERRLYAVAAAGRRGPPELAPLEVIRPRGHAP